MLILYLSYFLFLLGSSLEDPKVNMAKLCAIVGETPSYIRTLTFRCFISKICCLHILHYHTAIVNALFSIFSGFYTFAVVGHGELSLVGGVCIIYLGNKQES